jgi:nucleoside-diphosphate-sugar epimerase
MAALLCFGLGYTGSHYLARFGSRFERVVGTVRTPDKAASLAAHPIGGTQAEIFLFDGSAAEPALAEALAASDAMLISAPPGDAGDPVLGHYADTIAQSTRLRSIVYLSTVGVYGDRGGDWVDEDSEPRPGSPRSVARVTAEAAWQKLGAETGKRVAVLRLAGIYGPGRNALVNLVDGTARRIVKPGQVFNRIHVADIAQAVDACFAQGAAGVFNIGDDEPAPPQDVVAFAAELLGVTPPPEIPFDAARATMSTMARSFYADNRRVRNAKLTSKLGVRLEYPTYREGLRALFEGGDGR